MMSILLNSKNSIFAVVIAVLFLTYSAQFTFADVKSELAGTWQGELSGLPFELKVWEAKNEWNAAIFIQGELENLEVLGWKESFNGFYFFRPADVACISMYAENGTTFLTYFEKDNVRKIVLKRTS